MISLKLDTKALEHLLCEDDGSFKLDLQQSVLEEFSRRHIKAFINDGAFKKQVDEIKHEAIKEIEGMFGEWKGRYGNRQFELHQDIKNLISLHAKSAVTNELEKVTAQVEKIYADTAKKIEIEYSAKALMLEKSLADFINQLEEKTEAIKEKLFEDNIDGIIKKHIKTILAESFS